jgi:hypothetical protein
MASPELLIPNVDFAEVLRNLMRWLSSADSIPGLAAFNPGSAEVTPNDETLAGRKAPQEAATDNPERRQALRRLRTQTKRTGLDPVRNPRKDQKREVAKA